MRKPPAAYPGNTRDIGSVDSALGGTEPSSVSRTASTRRASRPECVPGAEARRWLQDASLCMAYSVWVRYEIACRGRKAVRPQWRWTLRRNRCISKSYPGIACELLAPVLRGNTMREHIFSPPELDCYPGFGPTARGSVRRCLDDEARRSAI